MQKAHQRQERNPTESLQTKSWSDWPTLTTRRSLENRRGHRTFHYTLNCRYFIKSRGEDNKISPVTRNEVSLRKRQKRREILGRRTAVIVRLEAMGVGCDTRRGAREAHADLTSQWK